MLIAFFYRLLRSFFHIGDLLNKSFSKGVRKGKTQNVGQTAVPATLQTAIVVGDNEL